MNAVPGFFASLFGEVLLDNDCDNIEADPKADPIEKELCRSFRQFSNSFQYDNLYQDREGLPTDPASEDSGWSTEDTDPQALRDSILGRPEQPGYEEHLPRSYQRHSQADKDLDSQIEADPSLFEEFLEMDEAAPPTQRPRSHFSSSYSSVVITRKADGSYEERRTVCDSDGKEEVTVIRSDGHSKVRRGSEDWREAKSSHRFRDWFWPKRS